MAYKYSSESYNLDHGDSEFESIYWGDAFSLANQIGGNDSFYGASYGWGYTAYGDSQTMGARAVGGNDYFNGGSFVAPGNGGGDNTVASLLSSDVHSAGMGFQGGVHFAGDALDMASNAVGGNDIMVGGHGSLNEFAGDALGTMIGTARGGNDSIWGGSSESSDGASTLNLVYGDGFDMSGSTRGGADRIFGGNSLHYGDGYAAAINMGVGDGYAMSGFATGGADTLTGGDAHYDYGYGDSVVFNVFAGDALNAMGTPTFGKDMLVGGNAYSNGEGGGEIGADGYGSAIVINELAGDMLVFNPAGGMKFGADTIIGGEGFGDGYALNLISGDAGLPNGGLVPLDMGSGLPQSLDLASILGNVTSAIAEDPIAHTAVLYANDRLVGGANQAVNIILGDAEALLLNDKGGNDTIISGSTWMTSNLLIGDAMVIETGATGGNDTIVGGQGNDEMWGDAIDNFGKGGKDVFVFAQNNGYDTIHDFDPNADKIDLRAFRTSTDMPHTFRAFLQSGRIETVYDDVGETADGDLVPIGVVLHLDTWDGMPASEAPGSTVFLAGVTIESLTSSSFLF